jgi:anti-sigma regulatory factor (Ser/Thr protein kinase)
MPIMALATSADTCGAADPAETVRSAMFRFDPVPESAGKARRAARTVLTAWDLVALIEDVDLVVSELVTNALLHTGLGPGGAPAPVRLELESADGALTCRVVDSCSLPPQPEEEDHDAESGRGLILVEALASAWDWEDLPEGKAVWARFTVRAD